MNHRRWSVRAALAALACSASVAFAAGDPQGSTLEFVSRGATPAGKVRVSEASSCPAPATPVTLALAHLPAPGDVELAGVHYRPRGRSRRQPESSGVSQIHIGYFDPDGTQDARFDIGIRGGPMINENLQIGLGVDWIHKSENASSVTTSRIGPGGVPIEEKQDIARASVNMFPIMGFVQISAPVDLGVIPYFGGAGGYQVLVLSGDDFQSGQSFEGTFSGWGWQLWGGLGVPLGGRTRFTGEVFVNGADLGRDATDEFSGRKVHETVNADGVGMRFGVAWGF